MQSGIAFRHSLPSMYVYNSAFKITVIILIQDIGLFYNEYSCSALVAQVRGCSCSELGLILKQMDALDMWYDFLTSGSIVRKESIYKV
jgi:hypothetical protein